ncbi:hypothetical protein Taro_032786 [Colocasia esculenta]|uniref:Uncharacterized protein n=1 Tax=Colocasia esculenta TaxID=4460 RepID=A0A843VM66_COLES|nr:hypothetical protein [Colocasia esculenta]
MGTTGGTSTPGGGGVVPLVLPPSQSSVPPLLAVPFLNCNNKPVQQKPGAYPEVYKERELHCWWWRRPCPATVRLGTGRRTESLLLSLT